MRGGMRRSARAPPTFSQMSSHRTRQSSATFGSMIIMPMIMATIIFKFIITSFLPPASPAF
jgi:hypothetical protein